MSFLGVFLQAVTAEGQPGVVCDLRVFTLRAFGRGAFVLSLFGAVGGVDSMVYRCVRAMRFGKIADVVEREELTLSLFSAACRAHHSQLTQAEYVLRGGLSATENQLLMLQRAGETEEVEDAREEIERLNAMNRAVQANKGFTQKCLRYFKQTLEIIKQKRRESASAAPSS